MLGEMSRLYVINTDAGVTSPGMRICENTNLLPPVVQQTRHLKVLRSVFWELNAMFYAQVNQVCVPELTEDS
ncbi:hypothetical protein J1605_017529 [Eschrichtius robustus]|uniref:Uncharacterized protein n=1 Tax=Eschrichtius robustus TaxID=9764 RepID=A0AB34I2I2_ESCRO|nr:hypothetical protein J1605_017529 [Eschrichtius robustus]